MHHSTFTNKPRRVYLRVGSLFFELICFLDAERQVNFVLRDWGQWGLFVKKKYDILNKEQNDLEKF